MWIRERSVALRGLHIAAVLAGTLHVVALIVQAWLLAQLVHGLVILGQLPTGWPTLLGGIGAAFVVRALANFAREEAASSASRRFRTRLQAELFSSLHRRGPAWLRQHEAGDLASQVSDQVDSFDEYIGKYLPQRALAGIGPVLILCVVFVQNWASGLLLIVAAPLVPFFMALVGWGTKAEQEKQLEALSRMSGRFLGLLRGLPSLRALMAHERQEAVVAATGAEFRERTMRVLRLAFLSSAVLEFFTMLSIALLAIYLGFSFLGIFDFGTWGTALSLSQALFILLLAPEFFQPLRDLGTHYHARSDALAAAGRLSKLTLEETAVDVAAVEAAAVEVATPRSKPGVAAGPPEIECQNLFFSYQPGAPVLEHFSLRVEPGQALVLTGSSGCGKTTLLQLLLGQLQPDRGHVLIAGQAIAAGNEPAWQAWRESVAWMGQEPALLAASLRENLLLARRNASDEELVAALDAAGLGQLFRDLPQGLDTQLGDGARRLSGGQLRRLALARLELRPARILLLDEPTASLDPENAALVTARIANLRKGKTLIALSHRSELFGIADKVLDFSQLMPESGEAGGSWPAGQYSTRPGSQGAGQYSSQLQARQQPQQAGHPGSQLQAQKLPQKAGQPGSEGAGQ